jgi:hypothetical protein
LTNLALRRRWDQESCQMGENSMFIRKIAMTAMSLALFGIAGAAAAQGWSAEQQEVWKFEEQQWKLEAAKDASWVDTMAHPNLRYWQTGDPMPRDKASLKRWSRIGYEDSTVREQEIFPISVTITGNVAVVQYRYMIGTENYKKERETVTGHYTDVLIKENGRWLFLAWEGGDDPEK